MADYTITAAEIKAFVPTAADVLLDQFVVLLSGVDACLEGAGVTEDTGKSLKRLAGAHMAQLTLNAGRGAVVSESVPAGSRSFAAWRGEGLGSSAFGTLLKNMDRSGCLTGFFENDGPNLFLGTAGT